MNWAGYLGMQIKPEMVMQALAAIPDAQVDEAVLRLCQTVMDGHADRLVGAILAHVHPGFPADSQEASREYVKRGRAALCAALRELVVVAREQRMKLRGT